MNRIKAVRASIFLGLLGLSYFCLSATLEKHPYAKIFIARSCDDGASTTKKVVPVAEAMVSISGARTCIDASTLKSFTEVTVRAFKNQFDAGSVEIEISSKSRADWLEIEAHNVGKHMVLLTGSEEAVLNFDILDAVGNGNILIGTTDLDQAKVIQGVLLGATKKRP